MAKPPKKKPAKKKKLTRAQQIDRAVLLAQTGVKGAKKAPKNPYPPGSARAKYWKRRQDDKKKMKKK